MSNITRKATIAIVKLGSLEFEGLMFEDGSFGVAVPQLANLFPYFQTSKDYQNQASKYLKRLMGKDFKTTSAKTEFNKNKTLAISLDGFLDVLKRLNKLGDIQALVISDALIGLALTQLFSDAFEIEFDQHDRQEYLTARLAGKITRRTLTDAIKAYLETHEVSDNYRKFVYSNCSDKINKSLFGKPAAKLCAERSCEKDELRSTHSAASLVLIDRIEGHAVRLIDRGMEPQIATDDAIDFYS